MTLKYTSKSALRIQFMSKLERRESIDMKVYVILEGALRNSVSFLATDDVTLATTFLAPLYKHTRTCIHTCMHVCIHV